MYQTFDANIDVVEANCWSAPTRGSRIVAVGTRVSSRAPRTEPYERLSRIRLVWGFHCQGCITPYFFVLLLHSFVRPAPRAFFRPDHILTSPSRAAMVKDGACAAPPKACP